MNSEPEIAVGILLADELEFKTDTGYMLNGKQVPAATWKATRRNGKIRIVSSAGDEINDTEFLFAPVNGYPSATFELKKVTIGIGFHWEQFEDQRFQGSLRIFEEAGKLRAVNGIRLEAYLQSVISSEMSAGASVEFLKAHAVISRSWLLAQVTRKKPDTPGGGVNKSEYVSGEEIIRWYDREDHANFDVCADDHCQRYQGMTKINSNRALEAVSGTEGEVLFFEDAVCDARFSKCCGGITENFENVWEPVGHGYLTAVADTGNGKRHGAALRNEHEAEQWIGNKPDAFCNTSDPKVLAQVLPDFDQKTSDFFRWTKSYSQQELSELLQKKSGLDFGVVKRLEPLERGHSGRIIKLKITGTLKTVVVGKELEIRKWLSDSHLYSSAFVVEHADVVDGIPQKFILTGAGWGHGVGLCQIGAAVMGEMGYDYRQILVHYFRGAELKKVY